VSVAADWLTAVGTCGAVIVSVGLAIKELVDKRKRDERRQAELITAWFVPYPGEKPEHREVFVGLYVSNASSQLIYDFVAVCLLGRRTAVDGPGDLNLGMGALIGNVPPGGYTGYVNTSGGALGRRHSLEFAFPDSAGRYWFRGTNGKLRRISQHPLDVFNISRGERWQSAVHEHNYFIEQTTDPT
jgi:hypothetical protein